MFDCDEEVMMRTAVVSFVALGLMVTGCVADEELLDIDEDLTAAWEENMNAGDSADTAACSGVVVPDRGPFNNKVALTFDDGPNLTNTQIVVDVLNAHGATGTFFINGRSVTSETHMEFLREMREAGHIIANHTETHPNSTQISIDKFRSEVDQVTQILDDVGVPEGGRFFRFPYGASNCATAEEVRSRGYAITGWHIDTADWCFANSRDGVGYCSPSTFRHVPDNYRDDFAGFTLSQAQSRGGGVLLMHDVHGFSANHLDEVLTTLENAGFEFVGLDDDNTFPFLNGADPNAMPFVGSPCAGDSECGFTEGGEQGYCFTFEDADSGQTRGFCSVGCEGYCPDRYGFAGTFCAETPEGGAGMCAPLSESINSNCEDIVGISAQSADRFIGSSSASARTSTVCLP